MPRLTRPQYAGVLGAAYEKVSPQAAFRGHARSIIELLFAFLIEMARKRGQTAIEVSYDELLRVDQTVARAKNRRPIWSKRESVRTGTAKWRRRATNVWMPTKVEMELGAFSVSFSLLRMERGGLKLESRVVQDGVRVTTEAPKRSDEHYLLGEAIWGLDPFRDYTVELGWRWASAEVTKRAVFGINFELHALYVSMFVPDYYDQESEEHTLIVRKYIGELHWGDKTSEVVRSGLRISHQYDTYGTYAITIFVQSPAPIIGKVIAGRITLTPPEKERHFDYDGQEIAST